MKKSEHEGFGPASLSLLERLGRNNSVDWFHEHKAEYQELVQEPMKRLVEATNVSLAGFAPEYATTKKNPLSRPNRDTRFSKDKSPYRTDISVVFPCRGLEKQEVAGFFIRVHTGGAELIAGTFVPGPDQLSALRKKLAAGHTDFVQVTAAKPLVRAWGELQGDSLRRVPQGYNAEHPAAPLLRMTQFYYRSDLPKAVVTSPELASEIAERFRASTPFVRMLDTMLGNSGSPGKR